MTYFTNLSWALAEGGSNSNGHALVHLFRASTIRVCFQCLCLCLGCPYQTLYFSSFKAALAAIGQLSSLLLGKSIHSKIVKFGVGCSIFFAKCLTDMYGKRGVAEDAIHGVSNKMKDKDTISWNSIVTAYLNRMHSNLQAFYLECDDIWLGHNGDSRKVIQLF
ncbi:hypothetical protein FH972_012725 [Carpinus fangiana]|uniref:Uncharacterized protein n=1 Tax=Carpinus fangiana TaxID=176857 RepID=A0A5N6R717_9ROSI|nr:hypothetical protein FH972_012725 [Carpinus fangiana]